MNTPETLYPIIAPLWRFWNLGHYAYFKRERTIGDARIEPFIIDPREADIELLKSIHGNSPRHVTEGRYVRLLKFQSNINSEDPEPSWQTVMSDTPDEMNDHLRPLLNARGRVLVHGLGLGCVLNCIRQKPNVTHIDVVEVSEEVLKLISPFFEKDKKIQFHHGSCVDMRWPRGTRWNYVWHDIWSTIADENLSNDETAEHGISYARLHRMFARRCDEQDSWAFELAQKVRKVHEIQERLTLRWTAAWNESAPDVRLEMMIEACRAHAVPHAVWRYFVTNTMPELLQRYERISQREMGVDEAMMILHYKTLRYGQQKVGMR